MIGLLIAAWLDVRSKPLRTFAAIAGMVAAVVAVVLVDAAGVLSRSASNDYLARRYGLPITASISADNGTTSDEQDAKLEALVTGSGFTALSPNVTAPLQAANGGALSQLSAMWVSSTYAKIRIVDLRYGAWPTETARSAVPHIVITEQTAQQFGFAGPEAVGKTIDVAFMRPDAAYSIQTTPLTPMVIDGVAADTTNAFANVGTLVVSDLPQPGFALLSRNMHWLVRVNPSDFGALIRQIASLADAAGKPLYTAQRVDQANELAPVLDQQTVTSRAVTLAAFTVGGLGIFGVGLASVRERGRDFGLRRALGASTARIFADVLLQSLLEALVGAAIAIPLASVALELFARRLVLAKLPLPASTALPLSSAALGLAGAALVGIVAGLVPAVNAARTSVVQALRG